MRVALATLSGIAALLLSGCGGDEGTGPPSGPRIASSSGEGQSGAPGTQLNPFRVRLTDGSTPLTGREVTWAVTSGGGSLSATTTTTDGAGFAESVLTLGPEVGSNTVSASAAGVSGSPTIFTATAEVPGLFESVRVVNDRFDPESVTIVAGGQVLFVWPAGARNHSVNAIAPATIPSSPGAPTLRNGPYEFTQTFNVAGTYRFYCSEHGTSGGGGMSGRVVVQ